MAPVEHAESHPEEVSSISASTSSVSSSPSSIEGRQEKATVCANCVCCCQKARQKQGGVVHQEGSASFNFRYRRETMFLSRGTCFIILARLEAHRTLREVRVVVAYIQKIEENCVVVYSSFGFGEVPRSAILERWSVHITDKHMESMKDRCIDIVGGSLEDLPVMKELWKGSILPQPADRTSSSSHSHPGQWYQQQADQPRQPQVPPAQFAQQQQPPQYQHGPHFHMPNPELNHFQGFMLPTGFQLKTVPVSTTVNYIVVPVPSTLPSGFPGQNGMCPNPNAGYYVYYQPVVHQAAGYQGQ